ncbi:hypothetical protein BZA05DRAFT_391219 [Tricharina praecox]|uniref:uncharacterized protein n=1 Tax=Tricharina praecox TaxID=43433 RepID=UPI00221E954E|nr:uncharacterized protein BZA05DRAFT_391219 [Tricharina praecox]KAI5855317.1 hypothetical protein BZA05DRAFT_391219 [Tricharina praecox]
MGWVMLFCVLFGGVFGVTLILSQFLSIFQSFHFSFIFPLGVPRWTGQDRTGRTYRLFITITIIITFIGVKFEPTAEACLNRSVWL